jgi:hypothetical protein
MGRNAPEQQYEVVFCKNQSQRTDGSGWITNVGYDSTNLGIYDTTFSITLPFGNQNIGLTSGNQFPVFPNSPAYITKDQACLHSFKTRDIQEAALTSDPINIKALFIWDSFARTDTSSPLPLLTGVTRTSSTGFFGGKYISLDNSGGVMLLQGTGISATGTSGYRVALQRITFNSTGIVTGSSYVIPDTITDLTTAGTGNSTKFTFAEIARDFSYTGAVKRVLVGYLGITGTTSGTLSARLAEISGEVITYGDPVIVRSTLSSGAHRQSIHVTHHSSGSGANCFVIATAVDSGNLAVLHSVSGQVVACNPPSGLTLSGFFGTPVTAFSGATFISRIACCAFECTTTSQLPVGFLVGYSGVVATSGTATGDLQIQMYRVSGTTLSITGTTGFTNFSSGIIGTYSTYHEFSGGIATNPFRNVLTSFSGAISGSGLFVHSAVTGTGIAAYNARTTSSGTTRFGIFRAPALFSDPTSGNTPITFLYTKTLTTDQGGMNLTNFAYNIPENPYSGEFGSAFNIIPRNGDTPALAVHGFQATGNIFQGGSTAFASGISYFNTGIAYISTGITTATATGDYGQFLYTNGFQNIIHVSGTFPNYPRIYTLSALSGGQRVLTTYDFGTSGEDWNTAGQVCRVNPSGLGDGDLYPFGIVAANPNNPLNSGFAVSGTTGYVYLTGASQLTGVNPMLFPSTGIPVKIGRTDAGKIKLASQATLTAIVFIKNKSVIDLS